MMARPPKRCAGVAKIFHATSLSALFGFPCAHTIAGPSDTATLQKAVSVLDPVLIYDVADMAEANTCVTSSSIQASPAKFDARIMDEDYGAEGIFIATCLFLTYADIQYSFSGNVGGLLDRLRERS